jgi:hypothetical protein
VIKLHLALEQTLERLKIFIAKDFLLLPRDSAMIKWAKVFVDKTLQFFRADHDLKCKLLWLDLLNARLAGASGHDQGRFTGDRSAFGEMTGDLLDLPVRYKTLRKSEKILLDTLKQRQQTVASLQLKYQEHIVEEANGEAAVSLNTRLGTTLENARQSPILKALGHMVMLAAAPIRDPSRYQEFEDFLGRQESEQGKLLELFRQYSEIERLVEPTQANEQKRQLKQNLLEKLQAVRGLGQDVLAAYRSLVSPERPAPYPIIVQKSDKTVTSIEIDIGSRLP